MSQARRIRTIYRKELIDVLRDRRTLLAMIVIPVVLYPLIMIAFVRAAESEEQRLHSEKFVLLVPDESVRDEVREILDQVAARRAAEPTPRTMPNFELRVGVAADDKLIEGVHVGLDIGYEPSPPPLPPQLHAHITYNEVDVRSRTAMNELTSVLEEFRTILTREALARMLNGHPAAPSQRSNVDRVLQPVEIKTTSIATELQRGGWALGQVIPLVLVLMTITGAIYPAIDLTAGERERGTLETLMVTPVSPLQLIVGKFLVVATIGLVTATLNIASIGATMHFSGLTHAISSEMPVQFPLAVLPIILLALIPFALLFSAVLIAVCSFARTFKEAQNYVMPVIIVAMIPAFLVTLPSVRLGGIMMVMPVGNMVLLTRELFQQTCTWSQVAVVVLSTTLYAAAAIAVAAKLFGQEAVLFADSRSYRTLLSRRYFVPLERPSASHALLLAALLFPFSFYAQSLLQRVLGADFIRVMGGVALVQFGLLFVLVPLVVCIYLRINLVETFRLRLPPMRAWIGALLVGLTSWILANAFMQLQQGVLPPSRALEEFARQFQEQLETVPLWVVLVLLAVVPPIAEEWFFRGFLLSGLRSGLGKWGAIGLAAVTFGVYHFLIDKVPLTALLGVMLGYICWQSRSLWPGLLVHAMHNGLAIVVPQCSAVTRWLGAPGAEDHFPWTTTLGAGVLFVLGMLIFVSIPRPDSDDSPVPATEESITPPAPSIPEHVEEPANEHPA